jgi:hypothetical protein
LTVAFVYPETYAIEAVFATPSTVALTAPFIDTVSATDTEMFDGETSTVEADSGAAGPNVTAEAIGTTAKVRRAVASNAVADAKARVIVLMSAPSKMAARPAPR